MNKAEQILEKIKEVLKEELDYEDLQIVAIVASPSKEEAWQLYDVDEDYLSLMVGEMEYLKNELILLHFFEEVQDEEDEEDNESKDEIIRGKPIDMDESEERKVSNRAVRNLDGKIVEVLSKNEIRTDRGILKLKDWFVEDKEDTLRLLRENGKITRETDKAIHVQNEKAELWIPKSVIVEGEL